MINKILDFLIEQQNKKNKEKIFSKIFSFIKKKFFQCYDLYNEMLEAFVQPLFLKSLDLFPLKWHSFVKYCFLSFNYYIFILHFFYFLPPCIIF